MKRLAQPGQLRRCHKKLMRIQTLMRKYNFDCGALKGKTLRRFLKWAHAFNKLTRRLIK